MDTIVLGCIVFRKYRPQQDITYVFSHFRSRKLILLMVIYHFSRKTRDPGLAFSKI